MNTIKQRRLGRSIAGSILVALAAGGTGWYWQRPRVQPPEYQTARVVSGDLIQCVTASGQLNPVVNVLVGSQISGTIQKLFVDYNSIVTNNQVIAQLDTAVYLAAVHQSEGELKSARAAWNSIQGLPPKMWARREASQAGIASETSVSTAARQEVK